ncbi:hypothetical protein LJ737_08275 [Hymenobacter sp. 15J16-1T3B]|uniref:hypothetical protein n=1 Tax=Hymenobacter sp. 15J16-1T3B TaxID=2886941 RepID=UPI001D10C696|nr:hypothetical protein [Hymenobacter sp. 15J16-1T3B]MCC3157231.1 hypothetical protein [Hymenobacter sp. 15J16-1T3B]
MAIATATLLLLSACSVPSDSETSRQPAVALPRPALRTEYWPVDTAIQREDTLLADGYRLRWASYSLNDSAVVDTVWDDHGPLLQGAHNEQTKLRGEQNGRPVFEVTLGKELFGYPAVDRRWHLIGFQEKRGQEAVFVASLCVPDSDICETAEIGVSPQGRARLLRRLLPEPVAQD